MILKDFLFTCESFETRLSTNNDSFPKEFRFKAINYAALYREISKNNREDLLYANIKSI